MAHATDAEIVAGIKLLAETQGIFAETAGGVTISCLQKLAKAGTFHKDDVVVAYITGNYRVIPFSLLYVAAFGTVAGLGLAQAFSVYPR